MAERRAPYIDVELLTPNEYSRPQIPIESVQYIAIHYTANPGSTAQDNRDYFNGLQYSGQTEASSNFYCRIGWRDHTMCTDMGDRLCIE